MLTDSFQEMQDQLTTQRIERAVLQLEQMTITRLKYTEDNAEWDDAYDYLIGKNPEFLVYNFLSEHNTTGTQMAIAYDTSRNPVGQQVASEAGESPFADVNPAWLGQSGILADESRSGLMVSGDQVLLLTSCPVRRSDRTGSSPGWLLFLQPLDHARIQTLSELTGVPVNLPLKSQGDEPESEMKPVIVQTRSFGSVNGAVPIGRMSVDELSDLRAVVKLPSLVPGETIRMGVILPHWIFQSARQIQKAIAVYSIAGGLIFLILALASFEWLVLRRIVNLEKELRIVAETRDANRTIPVEGYDEIASVARTSNQVLSALAEERRLASVEQALSKGILDSAGEGIMTLRPMLGVGGVIEDFSLATLNKQAGAILGIDSAGPQGRRYGEVFNDFPNEVVFADYVQVIRTGERRIVEHHSNANGSWYRYSICPWEDGVVVCFEDISKRKHDETLMEEMLGELTLLNASMMGREERVLILKDEVNSLRAQLGLPPLYGLAEFNV